MNRKVAILVGGLLLLILVESLYSPRNSQFHLSSKSDSKSRGPRSQIGPKKPEKIKSGEGTTLPPVPTSEAFKKIPGVALDFRPISGKADRGSLEVFRESFRKAPVQIDLPTLAKASRRFATLNPGVMGQVNRSQLVSSQVVIPREVRLVIFMDSKCYSIKKHFVHEALNVPKAMNDIDLPIRAYQLSLKKDLQVRILNELAQEKNCIVGFGQNAITRAAAKAPTSPSSQRSLMTGVGTRAQFSTNDPNFSSQRQHTGYLKTRGGYDFFYDSTKGAKTVVHIAILDSGVQRDHRDLAPNMWSGFGYNFMNNNNDASDGFGHGTMVAGLAAARMDNGVVGHGIMGLHSQIVSVKVLGNDGKGTLDALANGINWSVTSGIQILNLSLSSPSGEYPFVTTALENASANFRFIAIAAGNNAADAALYIPARHGAQFPGVMTVASADSQSPVLSSFSNFNNKVVEIAAPGSNGICSTTWKGLNIGEISCGQGTSYAAPIVAGTAGLILSLAQTYGKSWNGHHIEEVLKSSSPSSASLTGAVLNGKYLNLEQVALAVVAHIPNSRPPKPSVTLTVNQANPAEGEQLTFTGNSLGDPRTVQAIRWFADDVEIVDNRNKYTLSMVAKKGMARDYRMIVSNSFYGDASSPTVTISSIPFSPIITLAQTSYFVKEGDPFSVTATVEALPTAMLKWSFNGTPIAGTSGLTLSIPAVQMSHAGIYTLEANNGIGTPAKTSLTLEILQPPKIITQPPAMVEVGKGKNLTLKVSVTGVPAPTFQWFKDGAAIANAIRESYSVNPVDSNHSGRYTVKATNSSGSVTSTETQVVIMPLPEITTQPLALLTVSENERAQLSVSAIGTNLKYQWYFNDNPIRGSIEPTWTSSAMKPSEAGVYKVKVYNNYGEVFSRESVVTVRGLPKITSHPKSLYIQDGQEAIFIVRAIGEPTPTYQWYRYVGSNREAMSGQTTDRLTISRVSVLDRTQYEVEVKNMAGSVWSRKVQLGLPVETSTGAQPPEELLPQEQVTLDFRGGFDRPFHLNSTNVSPRVPASQKGAGK